MVIESVIGKVFVYNCFEKNELTNREELVLEGSFLYYIYCYELMPLGIIISIRQLFPNLLISLNMIKNSIIIT